MRGCASARPGSATATITIAAGLVLAFTAGPASASPRTTTATTAAARCTPGQAPVSRLYYVVGGRRVENLSSVTTATTVTAVFTVPPPCTTRLSLVSYTAGAGARRVVDSVTAELRSGVAALQVEVPSCSFRVALARGDVAPGSVPPIGKRVVSAAGGRGACR